MGNKQMGNGGTAATRAFSTTTPPTANSVAHHRLNRRRSDFQHSGKRSAEQMIGIERGNNNGLQPNGIADLSVNLAAAERARQRRRCSSAALVVARNSAIQKPKRMTPRQCHLVIKSWSKRSPKNRVAKDIFADRPPILWHTRIYLPTLWTLSFAIWTIFRWSPKTRSNWDVDGGFRPEYWNIFTECICEGVCAAEEDKESCVAWRLLVQTIVYYMKLGYDRERLRIQRHSSFRRSASPLKAPHELPEATEQQSLAAHNGHKSPTPQQLLSVALDEYR
uniref:Uncharacterized protein n=1 Tax=Globodera rostochiensis TaxID=31243 RepID=A0A914I658_GLORO